MWNLRTYNLHYLNLDGAQIGRVFLTCLIVLQEGGLMRSVVEVTGLGVIGLYWGFSGI